MLFSFENYCLDTDRRELRRSSALVPVEPQVFDLLAFLIRNRDHVVTKDDLLASVWGGRVVSESTLATRINAARAAVADSGEAQRLIRTLPRKGFRFVGEVREEHAPAAEDNANGPAIVAETELATAPPAPTGPPPARRWLLAAGIAAAVLAAIVLAMTFQSSPTRLAVPAPRFDASVIPLLDSRDRAALADYDQEPDHKALAISAVSVGKAVSAANDDDAKSEAMQRCRLRPQSVCTLYAVGADIVWPKGVVPVAAPGDLRTEPRSAEFLPADLAGLSESWRRAAEAYATQGDHRAFALSQRGLHWVSQRASREEAVRLATERCGYEAQVPCLLVSVEGYWTVELPKSHRPVDMFLPRTDPELPADQRAAIALVYQGEPWRALARGRNGSWHAVAGAPSEDAAATGALQACARADSDCRLFAIGNFRIADDK